MTSRRHSSEWLRDDAFISSSDGIRDVITPRRATRTARAAELADERLDDCVPWRDDGEDVLEALARGHQNSSGCGRRTHSARYSATASRLSSVSEPESRDGHGHCARTAREPR